MRTYRHRRHSEQPCHRRTCHAACGRDAHHLFRQAYFYLLLQAAWLEPAIQLDNLFSRALRWVIHRSQRAAKTSFSLPQISNGTRAFAPLYQFPLPPLDPANHSLCRLRDSSHRTPPPAAARPSSNSKSEKTGSPRRDRCRHCNLRAGHCSFSRRTKSISTNRPHRPSHVPDQPYCFSREGHPLHPPLHRLLPHRQPRQSLHPRSWDVARASPSTASISSFVHLGVICCEQFQSNAATSITITQSIFALYPSTRTFASSSASPSTTRAWPMIFNRACAG